jgi:acetyl-CoA carboxylase biotin carboxyl carrier protein
MELTHDDVTKIIAMIDSAPHLDDIEIVFGGFRLHVRRSGDGGPRAASAAAPPVPAIAAGPTAAAPVGSSSHEAAGEAALAAGEIAIRAPMLGTFYRAPAPGEPPFVEVGQRVEADDTVFMIEVMKLFSSIRAGVDGVVTRILADNESLVEYDQVLIVIAPDEPG